ncbi:unnamed protein product [Eretmochelys imbricata]
MDPSLPEQVSHAGAGFQGEKPTKTSAAASSLEEEQSASHIRAATVRDGGAGYAASCQLETPPSRQYPVREMRRCAGSFALPEQCKGTESQLRSRPWALNRNHLWPRQ